MCTYARNAYIFVKQAFEIELLKVISERLFRLLLVINLLEEHAEMGTTFYLELSSGDFLSPVE
ncbi:hypothetical protein CDIOL_32300 [Clostridium diolis]|uniref:Uncharacterized protein n=1 Tax=Clostridium diolis TaxID=223919 RepID=A0AAV3W4B4_9CLOT|nr:hypothetical protein CDIOL_32300 [Clostridium diolis]